MGSKCGGELEEPGELAVEEEEVKEYTEDDESKIVKLQARVRGNNARKDITLPIEELESFP